MCDHAALHPQGVIPRRRTCERAFPGHPSQVRHARALVAALLGDCPAAADAVLLISELAANACAHTASGAPDGIFIVRAALCPHLFARAEVEDQGSTWDGNISTATSPHGLYLMRALSSNCGTRRGHHGWVTWFTLTNPVLTGQKPQP